MSKQDQQRKQRERMDRYLEKRGLLNYQTKGMSQGEIAQKYENAGVHVQEKWFNQQYGGGGGQPQQSQPYLKPQAPSQPQFDRSFGVAPGKALESVKDSGVTSKINTGWGTFAGQVNAPLDPMRKSIQQFAMNNGMTVTQGQKPEPMQLSAPLATVQDALNGSANWSDVEIKQREAVLNDPNFYATNQITKYPKWMQQQILADPNFKWDNLPKWQKIYYNLSSSPAGMGAVQGGLMGLGSGPAGGAIGGALGAGLGWAAQKSGYDTTKEAWQQKGVAAKAFGWMNFLAEQAEKAVGVGAQAASALIDNNPQTKVQDAFTKEGWNAGSVAFETLAPAVQDAVKWDGKLDWNDALRVVPPVFWAERLWNVVANPEQFKGEEIYLGANVPETLQQSWTERMDEARQRIKRGENYREVMTEFQTGIVGQMGDMAGQAFADPLNYLPSVGNKVAGKVAELTGNKVAAEAFKTTEGFGEAQRKYRTLVQTGEALKIEPKFKVDEMGALSKWAAGLNQAGQIKAGGITGAGLLDPVKAAPKKNLTGWLDEMTSLTPQSRAQLGAGMFYENVGALLTRFDDPHEAGKYLKALSNSDMETWAQLGSQFADSPEFYTVLPALKDFNAGALDGIVRAWDESAGSRDTMMRVADILGEQPGKWLEDAGKRGTFEQDFRRLVEKVQTTDTPEAKALLKDIQDGRLTPDTLKQAVDAFTGEGAQAWHPGQWKAQVMDAMGSHFDEWVTKRMMLDQTPEAKSAFFRTAALMKTAQSVLLLGGSPGYAITNGLSNMVHRAATGIFGYMTPNQINGWMDRFGVNPARFEEGVGIGGMVEQASGTSSVKQKAMIEAVKGKGFLADAKEKLGHLSSGMPFSKLSSWFEKSEGRQAFTIGMRQFWNESWRRGKGFREMSPELVQAIKGMGVDPNHIYAAIEAGMNQGEIEKSLYGRWEGVQSRSLVDAAAKKTGISASSAAQMLDKIGLLDTLDSYLKGQTTQDGVSSAFARAERMAQDWIDMQTGEDLKAMAEHVKQKVGLEGAASGLDVVHKARTQYFDTWMEHYFRFGDVMEDLALLPDEAARSKAIDMAYETSGQEFRRSDARFAANMEGIFGAWGMSGNADVASVLGSINDSGKAMSDAYRAMRSRLNEWRDTWSNDPTNPARWDELDAIKKGNDKLFEQAFKAKHDSEVKMRDALGNIYEQMFGPAAGEAARKWWEDVIAFNDDIVKREQKARKEFMGMDREQRTIAKQKYYQETKIGLIAEAQKINEDGIARLERVIRKGGGQGMEGGATPRSPMPKGPEDVTPVKSPVDEAPGTSVPEKATQPEMDEVNALLADAEKRKTETARVQAERMGSIWDVAEEYGRESLPYDRKVLQDKFALLGALRKPEYGGLEDLTGFNDERLTPEFVRSVMENRRAAKDAQVQTVVERAMVNAQEAASNVKAPKINEDTTILRAISEHGGIRYDLAQDLTGERRPKTAPGVFTKKGVGIDEMARMLADDGYPIDLNDVNDPGGIQQATALIERARAGDKVYPMAHDHEAMLARMQDHAAAKAFEETFNYETTPEVPFDGALWQKSFDEAVRANDLTSVYERIGELPEAISDQPSAVSPNETWVEYVSRVSDEVAARVEQDARDTSIAEAMVRHEDAIRTAEERSQYAMTRNLLKEKFAESFGLTETQAQAYMELSDAMAGWYERTTGESKEGMYARYYEDVVKSEGGRLNNEALNQLEPVNRKMNQAEVEGYARALVRQGPDELRRAVQGEGSKADRIALLNEVHKLNPDLAVDVAKKTRDILFQNGVFKDAIDFDGKSLSKSEHILNLPPENIVVLDPRYLDTPIGKVVNIYKTMDDAVTGNTLGKYAEFVTVKEFNKRVQGIKDAEFADMMKFAKGAVVFDAGGIKATIHAFEAADFSTLVHENGHVFRRMLSDVAERTGNVKIKADLATIEEWAGVKDGVWAREHEEKFARGFERYIAEGKAPTPKLVMAFESFRNWMVEVYRTITGSAIDVKLTDEVRSVFDRMLGEEGTRNIEQILKESGDQRQPVFKQLRSVWDTLDTGSQNEAMNWILQKTMVDPLSGLETLVAKSVSDKPKGWVEATSDLNALTAINNTWGHGAGDAIISGIGEIAKVEVEKVGGRAFRVGGDEMSYWFPDEASARQALDAIDVKLQEKVFNVGGQDRSGFSVSYGIGETAKQADTALYQDKTRRVETGQRSTVRDQMPPSVRVQEKLQQIRKETALYQQAKVTESPEFRNWFGESKVVDESGQPLVVYHGTGTEFDTFKVESTPRDAPGNLKGFYFADQDYVANRYGDNVMPVFLSIKNPFEGNPFEYYAEKLGIEQPTWGSRKDVFEKYNKTINPENVEKFLKDDGYDGVVRTDRGFKEYTAFNPEQIKSVNNRGTFDPSNPNILFQDAGLPVGAMDEASQFLPHSEVMDEGWMQHVKPVLEAMREGAYEQLAFSGQRLDGAVKDMSPEGQRMLKQYVNGVKNDMATSKLASMRWGESQRDFAMLNYNRRYGFDRWMDVGLPYQFYMTRSMVHWGVRAFDAPAWYSNYARLRMQQNRYERDIPERLRGKVQIPAPWLPDWMGDSLYIDPMQNLFTPANFLKPFERAEQDRTQQQLEAERVLQEWASGGNYSEAEIQQAVQKRSGTVWERALQEASVRRESEMSNPADFFTSFFGPAWYLSTPLNLAGIKVPGVSKGDPSKVTSLPLGNTSRALDAVTQGTWAEPIGNLLGLIGKGEDALRKNAGLPTMGEYGEYYTKRQLTNMVIEGKISTEDAQLAMIAKKGELWDEASQRVQMELAMRVPGAAAVYAGLHEGPKGLAQAALPSLFGSGLLPAGELEFRGLKQEWNEAWKKFDAGDKGAVTDFFDEHPEYQAYLSKGKNDDELMQSFLVGKVWDGYSNLKSQVWEKYMALGKTNQKLVSAELGTEFTDNFINKDTRDYSAIPLDTLMKWNSILSGGGDVATIADGDLFGMAFLNKETRSYDSISTETLIEWARALEQTVPTVQNGQEIAASTMPMGTESVTGLNLYDPSVTQVTDQFFAERTQKFPDYYTVQAGYYALPKSERATYLRKHPDLKEYWGWKDQWYNSYPDLVPVMNGQVFKRVDTSGWPPMLEDFVAEYAYTGDKIPQGAKKALEQQWIMQGRPNGDLDTWINSVVVPGMLYGN